MRIYFDSNVNTYKQVTSPVVREVSSQVTWGSIGSGNPLSPRTKRKERMYYHASTDY